MLLTKEQELEVNKMALKREKSVTVTSGQAYWYSLIEKYPKFAGLFVYNEYDCFYNSSLKDKLRKYLVEGNNETVVS